MKKYFIHKNADVQTRHIGAGTRIWQFCVVLPGTKIGSNCNICAHSFIESDAIVGNNVSIHLGAKLHSGIIIEDNVFIGANTVFTNSKYPRKNQPRQQVRSRVKKGASIGVNSVILPGITIGCNAFVGAGSIVTKDVKDYSLVFGNPAVFKGWVCNCHQKLIFNSKKLAKCNCGKRYSLTPKNTVEELK